MRVATIVAKNQVAGRVFCQIGYETVTITAPARRSNIGLRNEPQTHVDKPTTKITFFSSNIRAPFKKPNRHLKN